MAKISTGAYLKASQLTEVGETRLIVSCRQEPIRDGSGKEELRWILYLDGGLKPLILNSTNIKTLVAEHGEETDNHRGRAAPSRQGESASEHQGPGCAARR